MKKELLEDLERLMAFVPNINICGGGYKEGWENEVKEMRDAIDRGVEITEHWCARDLTVPLSVPTKEIGDWKRQIEQYQPRLFFDGSNMFRAIATNLVHIHSSENPSKEMLEYRGYLFNNVLK